MSRKQKKNTDELSAEATRRVFPPFKRIFKDKSKYSRRDKHKKSFD